MPEYYMLECYGPDGEDRAGLHSVHGLGGLNWMLGSRFPDPIPAPIQITLDADRGMMLPMFNAQILLFRDDLLAAVRECGIDNLDVYDTELFNPLTNERFRNYKAINIIGAVSAADLAKSQFQAHGAPIVDVEFDSVAIDSEKANGLLMFRLAENVSAIVVHERVKRHVEKRGIKHLDWIDPGNWMG
jgi:hypothetical protein